MRHCRLLCARRERSCRCRAAEPGDEFAALYSIIWSARIIQQGTGPPPLRIPCLPCGLLATSSKPALWPLIIVPIVLPRIVVLAAAPERIVETPATPAEAEVVTARDAEI